MEHLSLVPAPETSITPAPDDQDSKPNVGNISLGLNRTYAVDWNVQDAMRELYQNWKDAILQRSQMSALDFLPHVSVTPDEIIITVEEKPARPLSGEEPVEQQVLGYIRFNKIHGSAEFTNFGSILDPQCLEMGHSTKRDDDRLAGGHGEGLKIAALVLSRENHHVRVSTNGLYWNFGFNGQSKANFYCRLTEAKPRQGQDRTSSPWPSAPSRLSARTRDDVAVMVTRGKKGQRLSLDDFRAWMCDTVDLHAPSGRIRTPSGDLLLESVYQGRLYLKGARVAEQQFDDASFCFGYNLIRGSVDRDRKRLVNTQELKEELHSIWGCAIAQAESIALPRYVQLFRDHPSALDVRGADRVVTEITARKMWTVLQRDAKMKGVFYCHASRQLEDYPLIRAELKQEPSPLPDMLWRILRTYDLVRTPMEELHHRFEHSEVAVLPDTPFAHELSRTVSALLAVCPHTQGTQIRFVRCDTRAVEVAYRRDGDLLYIHEKWLEGWDACTQQQSSGPAKPDPSLCQRRAGEIYRRAMTAMSVQIEGLQSGPDVRQLLEAGHNKLEEMPRWVRVSLSDETKTVRVSFYTGHSLVFIDFFGARIYYLVILHRATCVSRGMNLLYHNHEDVCACPRTVTPLSSRTAVFRDLDSELFLPMVVKLADLNRGQRAEDQPSSPRLMAEEGALIGRPYQEDSLLGGFTLQEAIPSLHCVERETCSVAPSPVTRAPALSAVLPDPKKTALLAGPIHNSQETPIEDSCVTVWRDGSALDPETHVDNMLAQEPNLGIVIEHRSDALMIEDDQSESPPSRIIETGLLAPDVFQQRQQQHSDLVRSASSSPEPKIAALSFTSATEPGHAGESVREEMVAEFAPPNAPDDESVSDAAGRALCNGSPQSAGGDDRSTSHAHGSCQVCGDKTPFVTGRYVQVMWRKPHMVADQRRRHVLYIHNALLPTGTDESCRLIATTYSFLADHPTLAPDGSVVDSHELLLHCQDPDRMGKEDDAVTIDIDSIVAIGMGDEPWTVSHTTPIPPLETPSMESSSCGSGGSPSVSRFFARYAIRDGLPLEPLFVTPLRTYLCDANAIGNPVIPRFTVLPVASVFDFSPQNPSISAGYAEAGYQIGAAIGFDERTHQLWKKQHPQAAVYAGDPASVIADLDSAKAKLPELGDSHAPRIVTISATAPPPHAAADCLQDEICWADGLECHLRSLGYCSLAAQSPTLSPDFIVVTLSNVPVDVQIRHWLAKTTDLLLRRSFSIVLRKIPLVTPGLDDRWSIFLLAAPCSIKPQWIDDTLSDLGVEFAVDKEMNLGNGSASSQQRSGVPLDPGRHPAAIISRILGEFSKQGQAMASASATGDVMESEGRQKRRRV